MARRLLFLLAIAGAALAIAAPTVMAGAVHGSATIRNLAGEIVGTADFVEDATGVVHVNVHVRGVSPGLHGLHIHNTAACVAPFSTAGGHHNPLGATHGSHAGDLPNLEVNVAGVGHLNDVTIRATLSAGQTSIFDGNGSALIIHAGTDDYVTDPTGNSGARIACGVIVAD